LHNIFSGAKKIKWQKHYEDIMKRHLELCVDLKDFHTAKDGLHQYRNMVLRDDPNSLEVVINHLMDLAKNKASEAKENANNAALLDAAKISDLEQQETPESIMLSSMTEEGSKDRTDREVVVPWLKFLWEIYRATLELLHRQAKLERLYHKICEKAYNFCLDYKRTHEFRRLCDMMRIQLSNLQKMASQPSRGNRLSWEWTSESIEYHLQSRFVQLEVATSLELWNEGFRTVEDIYAIIQIGKKTPKSKLMVNYYEKLTRIFLVSENYLFHAYAWYKYYTLSTECRKDLKHDEKMYLANCVFLSALCIPSIREYTSDNAIDTVETTSEKTQRMAMLLDFHAQPSRSGLLSEIISKGILEEVSPEIASLYVDLETKFQPLRMVTSIAPAMQLIKSNPKLMPYNFPLQKITVVRTMQQLSRVYNSIKLDFARRLFSSIELSFNQIEKLVIDAVTKKQLHIRIDHAEGCLRFGTVAAVASNIDTQIITFGNALSKILKNANKRATDEKKAADAEARSKYLSLVVNDSYKDHKSFLDRKMVIEQRKEALERLVLYNDEKKRQADDKAREIAKKAEEARLSQEEEARKRKDDETKKAKKAAQDDAKAIIEAGKQIPMEELLSMSETERKELLKSARNENQRNKEDDVRRLSDQAKRLDYITRALRSESKDAIAIKYRNAVEQDRKAYEESKVEQRERQKQEHELALVVKARLAVMQSYRSEFENPIVEQQRKEHEEKMIAMRESFRQDYRCRKIKRARACLEEKLREEEEKERQRIAEEKAEAAVLLQDEILRKQRQDEEDAAKEREHQIEQKRREDQNRLDDMNRDRFSRGPGADREREMDWSRRAPLPDNRGPRDRPDPFDGPRRGFDRGPRDGPRGDADPFDRPRDGPRRGFDRGPRDGPRGDADPFDRPRDGPRRGFDRGPRDGPRGDADPFDRPRDGPRGEDRARGPGRADEGGSWGKQRGDRGPR